jgi:hypothetical protein
MDNKRYLLETPLLDFTHPLISQLVKHRGWEVLDLYEKIGAAYSFVKDEIAFGYSVADDIPASKVLEDGYGQCNTKSTLLMALLRGIGAACRLHGFGIDKQVQKGVVPGILYAIAPRILLHTWVEVEYSGSWLPLEGAILDERYLGGIQTMSMNDCGPVCGYGVAVADVHNAPVQWKGSGTYIQKDAIVEDYGIFDAPDELYQERGANLGSSVVKRWLFNYLIRKAMNARVARIRDGKAA